MSRSLPDSTVRLSDILETLVTPPSPSNTERHSDRHGDQLKAVGRRSPQAFASVNDSEHAHKRATTTGGGHRRVVYSLADRAREFSLHSVSRVLLTVFVVGFLLIQTPLVASAQGQTAPETTAHDTDGEGASHGHSGGFLHHAIELLQVTSGFTALVAVGLAARQFRGGSLEKPLYIIGGGVGVIAIHRLWHGIGELNILPALSAQGSQILFLVGLLLLTAGFLMLWDSLRVDV